MRIVTKVSTDTWGMADIKGAGLVNALWGAFGWPADVAHGVLRQAVTNCWWPFLEGVMCGLVWRNGIAVLSN